MNRNHNQLKLDNFVKKRQCWRSVSIPPQTWTWVGSIHGLDWVGLGRVGLGRKFSRFGGLGWVGFIYAHGNFFV